MALTSSDFANADTAHQVADELEVLACELDVGGFDDERGFSDEEVGLPQNDGNGYEAHEDEEEYPVGRQVPDVVARVHEDGLTVRLPAGIEVTSTRDRSRPASEDPRQEFVIGQRIAPQVVHADPLACELSLAITMR